MRTGHLQTGWSGERLAAQFLEKQNYQILESNYRCPLGEIDLIARIAEYLVFVEVKTRRSASVHPSQSVNMKKIQKLRQLGLWYMNQKRLFQVQPRFDVVSIQWLKDRSPVIEHFINAF